MDRFDFRTNVRPVVVAPGAFLPSVPGVFADLPEFGEEFDGSLEIGWPVGLLNFSADSLSDGLEVEDGVEGGVVDFFNDRIVGRNPFSDGDIVCGRLVEFFVERWCN